MIVPNGDLDEDRTSGTSDMIDQNGANGIPHKETKVQNPESKDERNQTIAERDVIGTVDPGSIISSRIINQVCI